MDQELKELIKKIEENNKSKVLVYFTGDRPGATSQIGSDSIRLLYDHLLEIGRVERIDLLLYSRGGDVSVPWRIVSMIREFCKEFNVIIPYNAHSAATLLSLGADNLYMGTKAELGPIDPTMSRDGPQYPGQPPTEISVEDIKSYINFIKKKVGITDQVALSQNCALLTDKISPTMIGKVERLDHHIQLVARKILSSRNEKIDESKIDSIIEVLTEKIYSHGHAISRTEAKEIGLPVINLDGEGEKIVWDLYLYYEEKLNLREPLIAYDELVEEESKKLSGLPIAVVASNTKEHICEVDILLEKVRNIPQNPQINVSLNLNLPPQLNIEDLTQEQQNILNDMLQNVQSIIPQIVQDNIIQQSPVVGINQNIVSGRWVEK